MTAANRFRCFRARISKGLSVSYDRPRNYTENFINKSQEKKSRKICFPKKKTRTSESEIQVEPE